MVKLRRGVEIAVFLAPPLTASRADVDIEVAEKKSHIWHNVLYTPWRVGQRADKERFLGSWKV